MNVVVQRFEYGTNYTIGRLLIDGVVQCYTLEREVIQKSEDRKPAIPEGQYHVTINWSPHFQRDLPELLNVPGYEGIRIHCGNDDKDTEGCILVGQNWAGTDWISNSVAAFTPLYQKFKDYGADFVITITNMPETQVA